MSRRQKALVQLHFYALRQVQQAQGIGHHRPGFPQPRRYLLLGHAAVLHQAAVALGLLQRGQVLPLQVLYQRQLPHLGVIRLYYDRRDLAQSGHPAGPPAPLPRDDLIHPAGQRAHHHRLQNTMLPDGIRQLRQRVRLKGLSRLVLIGLNIGDAQRHQAAALRRLVIQEQGIQALPQSAFLCHRFLPYLSMIDGRKFYSGSACRRDVRDIACNRLTAGISHHRVSACTPAGGGTPRPIAVPRPIPREAAYHNL